MTKLAQEGEPYIHLTLTPKQAKELLDLLKDEVDWGYGLSDDLEALRQELKGKLKALGHGHSPYLAEHSPGPLAPREWEGPKGFGK